MVKQMGPNNLICHNVLLVMRYTHLLSHIPIFTLLGPEVTMGLFKWRVYKQRTTNPPNSDSPM